MSEFFPPEFEALKRENAALKAKVERLHREIDRLDEYTQHRSRCQCIGAGGHLPCDCGLDLEGHSRTCAAQEGHDCDCFISGPIRRDESPEIPVLESIDCTSLHESIARVEAIARSAP